MILFMLDEFQDEFYSEADGGRIFDAADIDIYKWGRWRQAGIITADGTRWENNGKLMTYYRQNDREEEKELLCTM